MHLVKADREHLQDAISEARAVLQKGGIIACPTESSYGLCARYDDQAALERLSLLKGRPGEKPFPLIIGKTGDLSLIATDAWPIALKLAREFWPGPLTLLFSARAGLHVLISKDGKVAVRVPGASFALELARSFGLPLTATSANPAGLAPATDARGVQDYFGDGVDLIVDGGKAPGGPASTIVDVTGGEMKTLREGAIDLGTIKRHLARIF
ncbi:MAG: L-threonylcarbamoyladenylate synthase [Nitrospiraceae bacterium]|nr:L-threonylcarbamoyladenylate synthase [Nitrospiraceae bacterium]